MFDNLPALSAPSSSELRDELDRYLSTDPEQVTDVCRWWYERRVTYPRLHRMALNYLTIPGKYFK
jgi:DNA topoisomerase IA